jgi:uncharacterized protein (DUF58 family)
MSDEHRPQRTKTPSTSYSVYSRSMLVNNAFRRMDEMQNQASIRRLLTDPALSARRSLYVIAGLLILTAVLLNYSLLLVAGLLILAIAVVPEIWYGFGIEAIALSRAPEVTRASFASIVETLLVVENRGALPLPFVEVVDNFPDDAPVLGMSLDISPLPGHAELVQVMGLWAFQRLRRRFYIYASQRGVFTFGPTTIKVTDPFGVVTREESLATGRTLIVHPLVAPLERLGLAPQTPFGDRAARLRLLEDPLRVSGVRQYIPGDDPRRIHWKATARIGAPQSKILDPSTQRTLMIALDVRTFKTAHMGYDPALSELAISAAASVATWAFENGYAVGVLSNGILANAGDAETQPTDLRSDESGGPLPGDTPRLRIGPSARRERLTLILDGLARILPYTSISLANLLASERQTLPVGASVVYIGLDSLVDVPTLIALRELRERGRDVTLMLTTREEDGDASDDGARRTLHGGLFTTRYIGGRDRWRKLVREALGELAYRRASEPLSPDRLRNERELIEERRRLRRLADSQGNEASGDEERDRDEVEGVRPSAVS